MEHYNSDVCLLKDDEINKNQNIPKYQQQMFIKKRHSHTPQKIIQYNTTEREVAREVERYVSDMCVIKNVY